MMDVTLKEIKKYLEKNLTIARAVVGEEGEELLEIRFPEIVIGGKALLLLLFLREAYAEKRFKALADAMFLQVTTILSDVVDEKLRDKLILLLNDINKASVIPGFIFDYQSRQVYFRAVLPVFRKESDRLALIFMLNQVIEIAETYGAVIDRFVRGDINYEDIFQKIS